MKVCSACKQEKPLDDFAKEKKNKDGRHYYCKACTSARHKAAYAARGRDAWLNNRVCSWCKQEKPKTEFNKTDGRLNSRCAACEDEISLHEGLGERRCNICREWQPTDRFYPSKLKFPHIACIACTRAQMTQPDYKLRRRAYTLEKEYGITLDQYKELLERQGHKCPVCLVSFAPGDYSNPLDHSHRGPVPGRIRAILHDNCNRFVMWMHDDSAQLRRAADLIDNPLTDWVVPNPTLNERRRLKEKEQKK